MTAIGACSEGFFEESDSFRDQVGKELQYLGHLLNVPFERATESSVRVLYTAIQPGKYGNLQSRVAEIAKRIFEMALMTALFPVIGLSLAAGFLLQTLGEAISSQPYYYQRGCGKEKWDPNNFTFFDLNACAWWGGTPIAGGGVEPARVRIDALAEIVKRKDADFVALQEVSFGEGLKLIDALKDQYPHFYTNIGGLHAKQALFAQRLFNMGPELFIASKAPLISSPRFIPFLGLGANNIGFFCLETPSSWMINVHLPTEGENSLETRLNILEQVHQTMRELEETGKPCFLMGDFNIHRTGEEGDEYSLFQLGEKFYDPCTEKYSEYSEKTATCTNRLLHHRGINKGREAFEIDDYILMDKKWKGAFQIDIELGKETYDLEHPEKALSDHRYYFARVKKNAGERT